MNADRYETFAEKYDSLFGPFAEHDSQTVSFYRQLFAHHDVRQVLDCACGTGRDLHLFHSLGCDVTGSDISPAMLAQAERNLASHNIIDVPLMQADFHEFPPAMTNDYDAVACLSSAIFELPDMVALQCAFGSMRGRLRDGGLLILTTGITDRMWREKPRFTPEVNLGDFTRVSVIDYLEYGVRLKLIDLCHDGSGTPTAVWSIRYDSVFLKDDIETALQTAGFRSHRFYADFEFHPYDSETSNMLIAVAVK